MTRLQWVELEIALAHQVIPTLDLDDPTVVGTVGILYANLIATRDDLTDPPARPEPAKTQPIDPNAKFLNAKDAARFLGLTYGTFRHYATKIRRTPHGRYTRDALEDFARQFLRKKRIGAIKR